MNPSTTTAPSLVKSSSPSISAHPSSLPSHEPSSSGQPSTNPSLHPSSSSAPSISGKPSMSSQPSSSAAPSQSVMPTAYPRWEFWEYEWTFDFISSRSILTFSSCFTSSTYYLFLVMLPQLVPHLPTHLQCNHLHRLDRLWLDQCTLALVHIRVLILRLCHRLAQVQARRMLQVIILVYLQSLVICRQVPHLLRVSPQQQ